MKRCPNSLTLRRFSGLLACSLTSSVSCFTFGLWAKSLARLNSDAIGRSLREGPGPQPQEGADRRHHPRVSHTLDPAALPRTRRDRHRAGAGAQPLGAKKLAPARLASAICTAIDDSARQARTAQLSERIAQEYDAPRASERIERTLA